MQKFIKFLFIILLFNFIEFKNIKSMPRNSDWHGKLFQDDSTVPAKFLYRLEKQVNAKEDQNSEDFLIDFEELSAESLLVLLSNPQNKLLKNHLEEVYLRKCKFIDRVKYKLFGTPRYKENSGVIMIIDKPQKSLNEF